MGVFFRFDLEKTPMFLIDDFIQNGKGIRKGVGPGILKGNVRMSGLTPFLKVIEAGELIKKEHFGGRRGGNGGVDVKLSSHVFP